MSTPIKYEDIRDGDRIRMSIEYTAASVDGASSPDATYELIERPVALPTEPGCYMGSLLAIPLWLDVNGRWYSAAARVHNPERHAPFTRLRPVAEVAAEVLADVRAEVLRTFPQLEERSNLTKAINRSAAKWATK